MAQALDPVSLFFTVLGDLWNHPETKWWAIVIFVLFFALVIATMWILGSTLLEGLHVTLPQAPPPMHP